MFDLKSLLQKANKELIIKNQLNKRQADELLVAKNELALQRDLAEAQALCNVQQQLLEKTLLCIGDAVISTDINRNIVFLNTVAEKITGWTKKEAIGKSIYEIFNIISASTGKKADDIIKKVMETGKIQHFKSNPLLITKAGKERLIEDSAAPIVDDNNTIIGAVVVFRDYSETWKHIKNIDYLIYHDQLTGLYNRRYFEEEFKRIDTKRNLPLSVIMGDINGLKFINDSFGHALGDNLLKEVANIMKQACRADEMIARTGGDEFVILLPKTNAAEVANIIDRIKLDISNSKVCIIETTISFGHAIKTKEGETLNSLLIEAENDMYRHKLFEHTSGQSKKIDIIMNALFEKSDRESLHSKRVSIICKEIALKLNLEEDEISQIELAGLVHDIGKIGIDDKILNKSGKLTNKEIIEIKKHPEKGWRILSAIKEFSELAEFILAHHEMWDGSGYPNGLSGEEIPLEARIIKIADAYDAMTSERSYKPPFKKEQAIIELKRCSGTDFDPKIVNIFLDQVLSNSNDF